MRMPLSSGKENVCIFLYETYSYHLRCFRYEAKFAKTAHTTIVSFTNAAGSNERQRKENKKEKERE